MVCFEFLVELCSGANCFIERWVQIMAALYAIKIKIRLTVPLVPPDRMESPPSPAVARGLAVEDAVSKVPLFDSAIITRKEEVVTITAQLSSTSYLSKETRSFSQTYILNSESDLLHASSLHPIAEDLKFSSLSPTSRWTAHFRAKLGDNNPSRIIEILGCDDGVVFELDVTDTHADFLSGMPIPLFFLGRREAREPLKRKYECIRHLGLPRLARQREIFLLCCRRACTGLEK